ncbi:redoxin domain-containing protein [Carboxylicivirga sp. RSCT41]|uniref:redoxin domain-containing protein n=1 Tax=Carboxylicivirga agarovorans TaxID=3417570 RepID=UPI003D32BF02
MKKLLCFLSIAALFACSQPNQFTLNGTIEGVDNDQLVIGTFSRQTMSFQGMDTVPVINGQFEYALPAIETSSYAFQLLDTELSFGCILENGELTLRADIANAQRGYIPEIELSGSPNHDLVQRFHAMNTTVMEREEFTECKAVYAKMMAAYEEKNYEAYEELKEEYGHISEDLKKEVWKAQKSLMEENIDKYFVTQIFPFIKGEATLEEMLSLYDALPESSKQTPNIISVKEDIDAKMAIQPGKVAPDFTLLNQNGEEFSLSSLKGQYVLIDFWASWCKPCRASFPHLKELYARYHDKGFEVVGVTNDTNHDMWKNAIREDQTPWIHVADDFEGHGPARVISEYGMDFLPSTVFIDPNGVIIAKLLHGDELDKKLEEIFGF